jgi:hypothetical protein
VKGSACPDGYYTRPPIAAVNTNISRTKKVCTCGRNETGGHKVQMMKTTSYHT